MGTHIARCINPPRRINSLLRETPTGKTPLVATFDHSDRLLTRIGRSYGLALRVVLCLLAIHSSQSDAVSQESTRSHRLLGNGMPTLSGGQSQMELLRRLQMLSGAAQADGKTLEDSPLADPEALKRLQQAMQSLQKLKSNPPGTSSRNQQRPQSTNDGSTTGSRNSEPSLQTPGQRNGNDASEQGSTPERSALQRIAEQMGLSLDGTPGTSPGSRSSEQPSNGQNRQPSRRQPVPGAGRTPPRTDGTSRPGSRPLTGQGDSNTLPERIPQDGSPSRQRPSNRNSETGTPSGDANSGRAQSGRTTPDPDSFPRTSERTGTGNGTPGSNPGSNPATAEPPKGSMQSILDWLKNQDQSASGSELPSELTGTQPGSSPTSRSATPGNGRSGQPRTNSGSRPQTTGRPSNNQGRDGSANADSSNQSEPATPGRSWFPGGSIAPPRSQQENTQANQDRMNRNTNQAAGQGRPSTNSENPGGNDVAPGGGATNSSADKSNDDLRQSIEDRRNAQREERLDEVRGSKKTLRQKLAEIAKLARSESDRTESSDDATDSETGDGLQSAFVDALAEATKGLAEQVDEIVTDDRFSRRGRDRRSSRRNRDGPFGQFAGLGNRANEWFVDAVEPEAPATTILSNDGSGAGTGSGFSPGLLAGLFVICGLAFWMLQRRRADAQLQSSQFAVTPAPKNLQNRQDIVQAFHDLAARCPAVMADWWTHDRAAQALATSRPDVDDEVRQLAQLYEQARYQSEDSALTDEQLAAAKAAWLRCRKS